MLGLLRDRGIGYIVLGKPGDAPQRFDAVLELAGGSAARLGIGIDDQVSLPWNERR